MNNNICIDEHVCVTKLKGGSWQLGNKGGKNVKTFLICVLDQLYNVLDFSSPVAKREALKNLKIVLKYLGADIRTLFI